MKFRTFNSDTGYLIPFSLKKDIPFFVKRIFIINGKKTKLELIMLIINVLNI